MGSGRGEGPIRNRGTIGGKIATASPAADVLLAVLALDGELELESKTSGNRLPLSANAIESPYIIRFKPDEILTEILIRELPQRTRSALEKLGCRNAMARVRTNMSVVLRLDKDGVISELRIVPGAVMPVARRVKDVEKIL